MQSSLFHAPMSMLRIPLPIRASHMPISPSSHNISHVWTSAPKTAQKDRSLSKTTHQQIRAHSRHLILNNDHASCP
jgi:hypothetical protein